MFELDKIIFHLIYSKCKSVGSIFMLGAFEGFIIYTGIIAAGVINILKKREKK